MSEMQSKPKEECKCLGDKKVKALEKEVADVKAQITELQREIEIIKKVLTR